MTVEKVNKRNPFAMPCAISKEMTLFMKKNGERVGRMEVTQCVMDYIKSNNLSDLSKIYPDETMRMLLGTRKDITFFNLNRYINKHYIK